MLVKQKINPIMHNVPKWSGTLLVATAKEKWVNPT